MRLHVIQHVPFEGPALIAEWAAARGHELISALALTEDYPPVGDVDFVIIMGGPMGADDEVASPWLHAEKRFIAEAIASGKLALGVCLGAQILAEVLGGAVKRNPEREIGWLPVALSPAGRGERLFAKLPDAFVVGQWHSDTFDLPAGLKPSMSSDACVNQAFVFDDRAVGLQFHLEWSQESLTALIDACADELASGGRWVMSAQEIQDAAAEHVDAGRRMLFAILDAMGGERPRP